VFDAEDPQPGSAVQLIGERLDIGRDLFISTSTVGYHLSNIYAKTGVNSRNEHTDSFRRDPSRLGLTA
jgi:hypothetical protein